MAEGLDLPGAGVTSSFEPWVLCKGSMYSYHQAISPAPLKQSSSVFDFNTGE